MSGTETAQAEAPVREIKHKYTFDLDNMSVEELTALRDAAEEKRRKALDEAKQEAVREFKEKLEALGFSLEDALPRGRTPSPARTGLTGPTGADRRKKRRDAGAPLPVKFRGPNGEEWSGRGREPRWLGALEATGRKREEFRV